MYLLEFGLSPLIRLRRFVVPWQVPGSRTLDYRNWPHRVSSTACFDPHLGFGSFSAVPASGRHREEAYTDSLPCALPS